MNKQIYLIILFLYSGLLAQVNTEKYRTAKDTLGFKFQSEINGTVQKGNVDFQEVSVEVLSQYNLKENKYLMIISGDFGWEDGKSFSNAMLLHGRNIRDLSAVLKLELFGQVDYDAEHLLQWRALAGAGTRIRLFGGKDNESWMGNSLFYEQEKYDLARSAKHAREANNIRFNTYLAINKKLKDFFTWHGVAYYQPKIDNWDDFKLIAETGLLVAFEEKVSLSIGFNYRFDSRPADGIKKNDYKTEMGLLFSF
jgi:uncharacterized protein DUF481